MRKQEEGKNKKVPSYAFRFAANVSDNPTSLLELTSHLSLNSHPSSEVSCKNIFLSFSLKLCYKILCKPICSSLLLVRSAKGLMLF